MWAWPLIELNMKMALKAAERELARTNPDYILKGSEMGAEETTTYLFECPYCGQDSHGATPLDDECDMTVLDLIEKLHRQRDFWKDAAFAYAPASHRPELLKGGDSV